MNTFTINERLVDITKWRLTPSQILAIGFASIIVLGTVLLSLPIATQDGQGLNFIDALFEATSAVCVTGLIVVDTGTQLTLFGQLVIISLIQVGGLGFMSMATLFIVIFGRRIHLKERLIIQEALNQPSIEGVVRLTLYVIKITLMIELIGAVLLTIRWSSDLGWGKAAYFGIFHGISSFCNAGFDLFGNFSSLTGYVDDVWTNLVISSLIILGGIGFTVIADFYHYPKSRQFSLHTKVVVSVTLFLIAVGTLVIFFLESSNPATMGDLSLKGKVLASYFQAVSPRTAGYNTIDMGELRSATLFFMVILMFIGASPASTGGGIKTTTLGVLSSAVASMVSGREDAELFKRRIPPQLIYKAFALVLFSLMLVIVVTMILSITETAPFLNILFEVTSAFGTVGLSTGITPKLTSIGKFLLILTMFAGRVGPLTVAVAISQRGAKNTTLYHYPEGKVIIG